MTQNTQIAPGSFTVIDSDDGTREVEAHIEFMRLAMLQASRATPITNAFNTGVLIVSGMHVVADGRSREFNLNKHAAEIAITKARTGSLAYMLSGSTMYTTMEPCSSTRVSKIPCTTHIINAHIKTIVIGVKEPESFVNCRGVETLCAAGINVIHLRMLQEECLATNIHLLT